MNRNSVAAWWIALSVPLWLSFISPLVALLAFVLTILLLVVR